VSKRYHIHLNHPDRPNFFPDLAWHRWQTLDTVAWMKPRSSGRRADFTSFARPGMGGSYGPHDFQLRSELPYAKDIIGSRGGDFYGTGADHCGTLVEVGMGRYDAARVKEMLEDAKPRSGWADRAAAGLYCNG